MHAKVSDEYLRVCYAFLAGLLSLTWHDRVLPKASR